MVRRKSPRYDVEMSNKLNFLAVILDFWRASWIDNGNFLTMYYIYAVTIICTNFGNSTIYI